MTPDPRIDVFTSCTTQGTCTLNDASLDGIHRTTPIGSYVDPQSGVVKIDNTDVRGVDYLPFGNNVDLFSQNAPLFQLLSP